MKTNLETLEKEYYKMVDGYVTKAEGLKWIKSKVQESYDMGWNDRTKDYAKLNVTPDAKEEKIERCCANGNFGQDHDCLKREPRGETIKQSSPKVPEQEIPKPNGTVDKTSTISRQPQGVDVEDVKKDFHCQICNRPLSFGKLQLDGICEDCI